MWGARGGLPILAGPGGPAGWAGRRRRDERRPLLLPRRRARLPRVLCAGPKHVSSGLPILGTQSRLIRRIAQSYRITLLLRLFLSRPPAARRLGREKGGRRRRERRDALRTTSPVTSETAKVLVPRYSAHKRPAPPPPRLHVAGRAQARCAERARPMRPDLGQLPHPATPHRHQARSTRCGRARPGCAPRAARDFSIVTLNEAIITFLLESPTPSRPLFYAWHQSHHSVGWFSFTIILCPSKKRLAHARSLSAA